MLSEYIGKTFKAEWTNKADGKRMCLENLTLTTAHSSHPSGLLYSEIVFEGPRDVRLALSAGDPRYPEISWPTAAAETPHGFVIASMPMTVHGDDALVKWAATLTNGIRVNPESPLLKPSERGKK